MLAGIFFTIQDDIIKTRHRIGAPLLAIITIDDDRPVPHRRRPKWHNILRRQTRSTSCKGGFGRRAATMKSAITYAGTAFDARRSRGYIAVPFHEERSARCALMPAKRQSKLFLAPPCRMPLPNNRLIPPIRRVFRLAAEKRLEESSHRRQNYVGLLPTISCTCRRDTRPKSRRQAPSILPTSRLTLPPALYRIIDGDAYYRGAISARPMAFSGYNISFRFHACYTYELRISRYFGASALLFHARSTP